MAERCQSGPSVQFLLRRVLCVTGAICGKEDVKVTLYDNAPAPHGWPDYFGHASTIPAYVSWQDIVVTSQCQWFGQSVLACSGKSSCRALEPGRPKPISTSGCCGSSCLRDSFEHAWAWHTYGEPRNLS